MKNTIRKPLIIAVLLLLAFLIILNFLSTGPLFGTASIRIADQETSLTLRETIRINLIFSWKFYDGISGCPYDSEMYIRVGKREFALANDDCYSAKDLESSKCIRFSSREWQLIQYLFPKYFGEPVYRD